MKWLGVLLCLYVLVLLPFLTEPWYWDVADTLDYCDTPLYFVSFAFFLARYSRLSLTQRTGFLSAYTSVMYKWIDTVYLDASYTNYVIVNVLICAFAPLIAYYYETMDNKEFRTRRVSEN